MQKKPLALDIQLFAEGGDGGASAQAGADGSNGQLAIDNNQQSTAEGNTAPNRDEEFKSLIKGDYKSEYEKTLNAQLNKRMKGTNAKIQEYEDRLSKVTPAMQRLSVLFNKSPDDIEGILAEVESNNSLYADYAMEHGISEEAAKTLLKAEAITRQQEEQKANEAQQHELRNKVDKWMRDGEALKQYYPDFDFNVESENESFRTLLNSGFNVKDAFEFIHRDELQQGAMVYAYRQSQQSFADNARANANRPRENGTSNQATAQPINDITQISDEQFEKLKRAVRSGERVDNNNYTQYI